MNESCSTGKSFAIRDYINCGTNNVVYSIECTFYNLQYVGCTTRSLRTRISEHYHGASYVSMSTFVFYGLENVKNLPGVVIYTIGFSNEKSGGSLAFIPEYQWV